jgi:hypothetical protein
MVLPLSDVVSQAPGEAFSIEPAFSGQEEPAPAMEAPSEQETKLPAGCDSDQPGNQVPEEGLAAPPVAPETPEFNPGNPGMSSRGMLRGHRRRGKAVLGRGGFPQFVQALAEQMLAQGGSAEDVARAARECGFTHITAAKVDRWLKQDTEARRRIIQRQMKTARDLQAALIPEGAAPGAVRADVALLGKRAESASSGDSSPLDIQDLAVIHRSLRAQLQTENDSLKRRAKRLEARKTYLARRIEHAQMRLDRARLEVVQRRLGDLRSALEESEPPQRAPGRSVFAEIVASLCQLLKNGD